MNEKLPCSRAGCEALASRYPRILVHAIGYDFTNSSPLALIVPLPTCLEHQTDFDPATLFPPESRARIAAALSRQGKALPDFDDARIIWAHIGDRDWRTFHEIQGQRKR